MGEIQTELTRLRERVEQLERQHARTNRGRVNQRRAAEYLGCSREHLRQLHLAGRGPRRAADGSYTYDDLDSWAEQDPPERPNGAPLDQPRPRGCMARRT